VQCSHACSSIFNKYAGNDCRRDTLGILQILTMVARVINPLWLQGELLHTL